MTSPLAIAKNEFAEIVSAAIKSAYSITITKEEISESVVVPDSSFGDVSTPVAYKLAKSLKKSPSEIASKIAATALPGRLVKSFSEASGYVNALLDERAYAKLVLETVIEEAEFYGSSNIGKDEKVLVEYPSVNPTKPWHVGHLRNALLGDAIANTLEFCGYKVERENYIDDLGLQVAETLWGYRHIGTDPKGKKFDQFLGEQYVEVNKRLEEQGVQDEIKGILQKMEAGNTEEARLSRELSEKCVKAQYETAFAYSIFHDVLMWESDIVQSRLLEMALKQAQEKKIIEKIEGGDYDGCIVLDLEKAKGMAKEFENPKEKYKVLVRSNGVATYAMKDFAFHMWKFGMLDPGFKFSVFMDKQPNGKALYTSAREGMHMAFGNAKKVVNIIDMSQNHEQATVKALIKLTNPSSNNELVHVAYGVVKLAGGTLSGRQGGWLGEDRNYTADDLLEEAIKKTIDKTSQSKKLEGKEVEETAKLVALAAIKFEYLKVSPEKEIVFSWDNALNLEANSGP
ncbi:MAG: arginine--tRNA ligase, partial [Candidatus Micrarchaeia archaeon]